MITVKRSQIFFAQVMLPLMLAAALVFLFRPVYMAEGNINYVLLWICVGLPFGVRRMFLWLFPHRFDLAGTVGVFVLNIIVGGIIGGFALIAGVMAGLVRTVKG